MRPLVGGREQQRIFENLKNFRTPVDLGCSLGELGFSVKTISKIIYFGIKMFKAYLIDKNVFNLALISPVLYLISGTLILGSLVFRNGPSPEEFSVHGGPARMNFWP